MGDNRHMAERYAAYVKLRDAGVRMVDAARELGVSERTAGHYERSYREERGREAASQAPHQWR